MYKIKSLRAVLTKPKPSVMPCSFETTFRFVNDSYKVVSSFVTIVSLGIVLLDGETILSR